ncbi:MAG: hypothetical protein JSS22_07880 [Proteobacteria bacterium]|nr:hypothetical protein [Pseudomonadota bacterium]
MARATSIGCTLMAYLSHGLDRLRGVAAPHSLSAGEADAIAHKLRIPRTELETLAARGRQGADELPKLLAALGLDGRSIAREKPGVMRDMAVVCALCVAKSRCRRELELGTAVFHHREYCTNSHSIDAFKVA